ncbi:unnamed protein product [Caenorhabditis angaria]|uniref:Serpentine receptor class r-10 n=1 Tax=Caenorhabditis angaria TaxID=860376 RepID=A0A9P1N2S2_9PELO|nr:unnamed protein product [Caenorhabditis angaria]
MNWNSFVDFIQKIAAGTSIFMNCILTILILFKSPKQLGSYKYLMIYIVWFEILYSILDVIITPIMFSHESIVMVIVFKKYSPIPHQVLLILIAAYGACFGISMGIFGLHFIYRYFVSTGSNYMSTFKKGRIFYWMLIPIIYGLIWGSVCFFLLGPSEEINHIVANKLMLTFGWEIHDISYLGPYFYQIQPDGSYKIGWNSVVGVVIAWTILFSSLVAIIYCGIKCYLYINSMINITNSSVSKNLRNLQAQLFYALVTQTAIPVILMHIPLSIVILFSFLDKDLGTLSGITSITISLFPALDPLPTMFIIKNYRTTIFGKII